LTPLWQELSSALPSAQKMVRVGLRLTAALIIGAVIGWQRELSHKPAGLRAHLLVALGSALLIIAAENAGINSNGVARVIFGRRPRILRLKERTGSASSSGGGKRGRRRETAQASSSPRCAH
jgi:hypothetical protein